MVESSGNVSPLDIRIARPLKVSYPDQCQKCAGQFYIQEDGPDQGVRFACGTMQQNIEAGCLNFSCSHFRTDPNVYTVVEELGEERIMCKGPEGKCLCGPENPCTIREIIDSDKANEALKIVALLNERKRPVIIAPPEPSPHAFIDDAIANINHDQKIVKDAVKSLEDCAQCPVVSKCSAHITDGEWNPRQGVSPCKVVL
jgi:hypothetical protein